MTFLLTQIGSFLGMIPEFANAVKVAVECDVGGYLRALQAALVVSDGVTYILPHVR